MADDVPEGDEWDGFADLAGERVLVAVVNRRRDWKRICAEHWYRIPLARAPKRLGAEYLAFYHTRVFGELRWSIAYYAPILAYRLVRRSELFPEEPDHPRAKQLYYKIEIGPLIALPRPIPSLKLRRITFIHTTLSRLLTAREIHDLWPRETPRERLWRVLQRREIPNHGDDTLREGRSH